MNKNKNIIFITLIVLILLMGLITVALLILNKNTKNNLVENTLEENIVSQETLEENFKNALYNVNYTEDNESMVELVFDYEESKENKYNVRVNLPKIKLETDVTTQINDEIIDVYGDKLLDIINNSKEFTLYYIDYVTYVNDNILSIVIKTTLKEGNNPQRLAIQTYNYDLINDRILELDDILDLKDIEKSNTQQKVIETVRQKNANTNILSEQGYNIYVRDIRSDEYLIENIKTFFVGEDGHVFILFPYGNKNFTETMDIIVL